MGLGVAPNEKGPEGEGEAGVAGGRKRKRKEGDRKRVRGPGRVRGRGERKSAFNARFNEEREKKVGIQCDQNCVTVGVAVMFHFN
jgi:hypothetical protein